MAERKKSISYSSTKCRITLFWWSFASQNSQAFLLCKFAKHNSSDTGFSIYGKAVATKVAKEFL